MSREVIVVWYAVAVVSKMNVYLPALQLEVVIHHAHHHHLVGIGRKGLAGLARFEEKLRVIAVAVKWIVVAARRAGHLQQGVPLAQPRMLAACG